jgi:DNA invertase Pin-like site-specific DNA recombinase
MNKKKSLVVAYCRVSTLEQKKKGYGIDIQIRDTTLYAERQGLLVERFYRDEAESGIKESRPELNRLMKHCQARKVRIVILPSLDRLSREVRIAENLFHKFKQWDVKILIADMPHYRGDRKDILIRQIMEAIAEESRKEIIERLWKGRQESVRMGHSPGGNTPYGYIRKNKVMTIHEKESEIVKEVYALAQQCKTGQSIAEKLNQRGYSQRNGKHWTPRQIAKILTQKERYTQGILRYGQVQGQDHQLIIFPPEK